MASAQKVLFVPFEAIRIRQRPSRESHLEETVELFSKKDSVERPFMRMVEQGLVYRPVVEEQALRQRDTRLVGGISPGRSTVSFTTRTGAASEA